MHYLLMEERKQSMKCTFENIPFNFPSLLTLPPASHFPHLENLEQEDEDCFEVGQELVEGELEVVDGYFEGVGGGQTDHQILLRPHARQQSLVQCRSAGRCCNFHKNLYRKPAFKQRLLHTF